MSSRMQAVAESASQNIASFRPESRGEVDEFFHGLPPMLRELGNSLTAAAENMEDEHIHPAVIGMLRELGHVVAGTADTAEQTYATHAAEHRIWLND